MIRTAAVTMASCWIMMTCLMMKAKGARLAYECTAACPFARVAIGAAGMCFSMSAHASHAVSRPSKSNPACLWKQLRAHFREPRIEWIALTVRDVLALQAILMKTMQQASIPIVAADGVSSVRLLKTNRTGGMEWHQATSRCNRLAFVPESQHSSPPIQALASLIRETMP